MKRLIAFAAAVVIVGGIYWGITNGNVTTVMNQTASTTVEFRDKEVPVPVTEIRIKEAQEAAEADITAKAQAAYQEVFELEMNKVKAQVLKEVEAEIEAQRLEVEKHIEAY